MTMTSEQRLKTSICPPTGGRGIDVDWVLEVDGAFTVVEFHLIESTRDQTATANLKLPLLARFSRDLKGTLLLVEYREDSRDTFTDLTIKRVELTHLSASDPAGALLTTVLSTSGTFEEVRNFFQDLAGIRGRPAKSKPLFKVKNSTDRLSNSIFPTGAPLINIDWLFLTDEKWIAVEMLRCLSKRVVPHTSHPRRYWSREISPYSRRWNWQKFRSLFDVSTSIQGRLLLLNYMDSSGEGYEPFRLMEGSLASVHRPSPSNVIVTTDIFRSASLEDIQNYFDWLDTPDSLAG